MASYKVVICVNLRNSILKSKVSPGLLYSRCFCSKNDEVKTAKINPTDSNLNEKEEHNKDTPVKAEAPRVETKPVSDDSIQTAAKHKLMSLLSDIKVETNPVKLPSSLNLARPLKRVAKSERLKQMQDAQMTPEKELNVAVKAVASSFKEDSQKIESELTEKLNSLNISKEALPEENVNIEDSSGINNEVNKNLMSSVKEVADVISESPIPPRSELAKRLIRLSVDKEVSTEKISLKSVIEGMAIKSQQAVPPLKISEEKRKIRKTPVHKNLGKFDLYGGTPLNIFKTNEEIKPDSRNVFWQILQERELRLMTQFAPANAFEEMIMWTEQGKHWKFPIDNQTEMGEEEKVGFHEHVFLEQHLEGFPTKGPIRHFIELVAVGLSKNPYITVERKIENIEWFRTYFKEKEDILKEEGVL